MSSHLRRLRRGAAGFACAAAALAGGPAGAQAATTHPSRPPTFTLPASARVHGAGSTVTSTPSNSTTTPAATAPNGAAPSTTVPASTTPVPGAGAPPSTTAPATGTPATPGANSKGTLAGPTARKASAGKTRLSTGALALLALGALLVLGCLAWAIARQLALEPRWSVSLMHSLREASYRGSVTWAEFSDWSRLGR